MRWQEQTGRKTKRGRSKEKTQWKVVEPSADTETNLSVQNPPVCNPAEKSGASPSQTERVQVEIIKHSKLGTEKDKALGESSSTLSYLRSSNSEVQPDSSDVETSDSDLEEGELNPTDLGFETVTYQKKFSGRKGNRGRGPKNH